MVEERKQYFRESESYTMIGSDVRDVSWMTSISQQNRAIVAMEGISMYLTRQELQQLLDAICSRFREVNLLMDCYTEMAAKMSKYKNPVNDVGVTEVYGLDQPEVLETGDFALLKEHDMTPEEFISQLQGMEQGVFRKLYAGNLSKKLYRLYEYRKG